MAIKGKDFRLLPPSQGVDNNWHVTDDSDTMVAHCYGFAHSIADGEELAHRIVACLNACKGIETKDLEDGTFKASNYLLK
jgi:hypothetical protein